MHAVAAAAAASAAAASDDAVACAVRPNGSAAEQRNYLLT